MHGLRVPHCLENAIYVSRYFVHCNCARDSARNEELRCCSVPMEGFRVDDADVCSKGPYVSVLCVCVVCVCVCERERDKERETEREPSEKHRSIIADVCGKEPDVSVLRVS